MADSFVHLHQHTEFSMLDGASRIQPLVAKAVSDGQPAVGITDHGVMYGVPSFARECRNQGIIPVIGEEIYMVNDRWSRPSRRGRRQDDEGGDTTTGEKLYYHLTVLAENNVGYRNLIHLSTRAFLEGFHYRPRADWELLEQYREGLIITTGCLGGMVLQGFLTGGYDKGRDVAGRLKDIFGPDHLFVELQDHGIDEQHTTNPMLLRLAKDLRLPVLATNDSHYLDAHDHDAHDALLCVQTGSTMSDPDRFKFKGAGQHYFKTAAEMRHLFRDVPEACDNTLWIAERSVVDIADPDPKLPKFPLPDGYTTADEYLTALTLQGAQQRWGDDMPADHRERLTFELGVIASMGFSDYFLVVWDLIRYAKSQGARTGPGRGSAAGCAVAYCLGITDIDPIKYDLLFERFLNPSRVSMPDIDLDIETRFRDEWLRYARRMYGDDRVCQIVTFSTIQARAAVRDAARVLDKPYAVGDKIAKAVPAPIMGRSTPIGACLEPRAGFEKGFAVAGELRTLYETDVEAREVIDVAKGLEGLRRQDGIHAAAVVIADRALTDVLPLQRKPDAGHSPDDAPLVSQYEMGDVEALGLLKMDFLGLRNLDVITDTVRLVKQVHGVDVPINDPPLDDPATFRLLQAAETIGVFQLESTGIQDLIRRLRPTTFDDVGALVALYRPGPMDSGMHLAYADRKNGRAPVEYLHSDAEDVLRDTYGLCIYQEQLMRLSQKFAGFSLADADLLRKAAGKKNPELMARERQKFVDGCLAGGYSTELGHAWFDVIEPFANYGFNKSHAYGYGFIAYQTAYLKANWPHEYMAALLSSVMDKQEKATPFLTECRRMGVRVLPPDVNRSDVMFTVATDTDNEPAVVFGLAAVRNVGEAVVSLIINERDTNGPYTDFFDFCDRVPVSVLNKQATESLVKAGVFDSLGYSRRGLMESVDQIVAQVTARRKQEDAGQFDLFSTITDVPDDDQGDIRPVIPDTEWDRRTKLRFEKEMLGVYASDHPLAGMERRLARYADSTVDQLGDRAVNTMTKVAGIVGNLEWKYTKKGTRYATFTIEDMTGTVEAIAWSQTTEKCGDVLTADRVVVVACRVDERGEKRQIVATDIELLPGGDDQKEVVVTISTTEPEFVALLRALRDSIDAYPGTSPVHVSYDHTKVFLGPSALVSPAPGLIAELKEMFGVDAVTVQ